MIPDAIILGGGPAGLTAGLYLSRGGKNAVLFEGLSGGLATTIEKIENYPGFPEGIAGMEFISRLKEQAQHFGVVFHPGDADALRVEHGQKTVQVDGKEYSAPTVVIATGTTPRPLNVPGETEFRGRGVSYCATCDGPFFRDRAVAVIGGGDSAVKEALYLADIASRVYLIHRRDQLRSEHIAEQRVRAHPKVQIVWDSVPEKIEGEQGVSGIVVRNKKNNNIQTLSVNGVFIYVGAQPQTGFLRGILECDQAGFVVTGENLETSVPGVFAAGDVCVKEFRQIVTAVSDGALAAHSVIEYLSRAAPRGSSG